MRQLKILLYHSDQGKMEWEQKGQKAMSTSIYNFEMKKKPVICFSFCTR